MDFLFYGWLGLSIFFFVAVVVAIIYFSFKYRKGSKADRRITGETEFMTLSITGTTLELTWTIVPLIMAAMMHFVPVLTRTGGPGRHLARLPSLAQAVGLAVAAAMQGWLPYHVVYAGAAVDLLLAAVLLGWIVGRSRATLGSPHPGWRWYGAGLGCLILALGAVVAMPVLPGQWPALRIFTATVEQFVCFTLRKRFAKGFSACCFPRLKLRHIVSKNSV